jgi:hypothetical protein
MPSKFREWRYSLYVVPNKIVIKPQNFTEIRNIQIVNNNPYPIYSVQLKIIEKNNSLNLTELKVKVLTEEVFFEETDKQKMKPLDRNAFEIHGETKDGNKWRRPIIYKINANSHVDIAITFPPAKTGSHLLFQITHFTREDSPIRLINDSIYTEFHIYD